jgi:putative SOS response-associated peptidase YedK
VFRQTECVDDNNIVAPGDYGLWLDPGELVGEGIKILLRPYFAAAMVAFPVGKRINYPANNNAQCISPVN